MSLSAFACEATKPLEATGKVPSIHRREKDVCDSYPVGGDERQGHRTSRHLCGDC